MSSNYGHSIVIVAVATNNSGGVDKHFLPAIYAHSKATVQHYVPAIAAKSDKGHAKNPEPTSSVVRYCTV